MGKPKTILHSDSSQYLSHPQDSDMEKTHFRSYMSTALFVSLPLIGSNLHLFPVTNVTMHIRTFSKSSKLLNLKVVLEKSQICSLCQKSWIDLAVCRTVLLISSLAKILCILGL